MLQDFLPTDNSIVLWSDYSNADAVADELVRLMRNKTGEEGCSGFGVAGL